MWTPIIIAVLLIFGTAVHHFTHSKDATGRVAKTTEEIVEEILRAEGVNIDFDKEDSKPVD